MAFQKGGFFRDRLPKPYYAPGNSPKEKKEEEAKTRRKLREDRKKLLEMIAETRAQRNQE